MTDIWTLLRDRRRRLPADPFVTFVDADGTRTELSATSLVNAAEKIANLFHDEDHGLVGTARVRLRLPVHWQRSTWLAGLWTAGIEVEPLEAAAKHRPREGDRLDGEESTFTTLDDLAIDGARTGPVGVVSLHPLGLPVTDPLPWPVFDATVAVRAQPDEYLGPLPRAEDAALAAGGDPFSQEQVIDLARRSAAACGLEPGGRLLVDPATNALDAWLAALAVPLVARSSVLLVAGEHDLDHLAAQEHVTAILR